ncbi:hypothetical protein KI387_029500, partial [Taxus chinensis]
LLKDLGVSIPMRATFFITYIMVDGWTGIAGEILRLVPLVMFHLKNSLLVKTEEDKEKAMDPGSVSFAEALPRMQLYFLLGLAYSAVTPIILPFIILYFGFGYFVFRHQEAMVKDTLEQATEPSLNLKRYLANSYIHPMFKGDDVPDDCENGMHLWRENDSNLVLTKRTNTPVGSVTSTSSTILLEH